MEKGDSNRGHILIVDDVPENLMMVVNILKEEYTTVAVTSGEKALEIVMQDPKPDIILLDIVMPEMDGFEVCRRLKSIPSCAYIPVIFITALEEEADILQGFDLGAVDYVTKPFEPKILKARVKTHLQLKHFNDELCKSLQENEALLLQQSKMAALGEMFENITHQWKQPLSIISLRCVTLRMEYDMGEFNPQNMVDTLDVIEKSVQHLSQTINDFKNFIHPSDEKERFEIGHLIDSTCELLSSKLSNREITVHNVTHSFLLHTYKNDLIQVLMNLFNNAIDALDGSTQARSIRIGAFEQGEADVIEMCDNGGGIDERILPNLFDKYVTTKKGNEGNGLGLYMSRRIVQDRLGGEIDAYIGADELFERFRFLEKELRSDPDEAMEERLRVLDHDLRILIDRIDNALEVFEIHTAEEASTASISMEELLSQIAELTTVLSDFDAEALDRSEGIVSQLRIAGYGAEAAVLERLIQNFDFEGALGVLRTIEEKVLPSL